LLQDGRNKNPSFFYLQQLFWHCPDMASATVNVNVGVLGHVDSGKTSLVRALSTHLSTASLDKHPDSKRRGITLDLGFSSFKAVAPVHFQGWPSNKAPPAHNLGLLIALQELGSKAYSALWSTAQVMQAS
jgi:hypothetical protein